MGSFDVPIKLTFSLDARRTVITEVVGQKKEERKWERKEGARNQMRRCHCRLILLCGLAGERCSLLGLNSAGGGDIWLSDDPILMSPIVARSLARLSHASSGDAAAMTKMAAIHKCFVILSSFRPRARPSRARPPFIRRRKRFSLFFRARHNFGSTILAEAHCSKGGLLQDTWSGLLPQFICH